MPIKLTTYNQSKKIPDLPGNNIFHSTYLFQIYEATPNYTPFLLVATLDDKPIAKMLAVIRKAKRIFPPSIIKRCEVYDTGEFLDETIDKEAVFGEMLEHLTAKATRESFLIEFRNLDNALFGYKYFRQNNYFPVNWLRVRNSLHTAETIEERCSPSRLRQIKKGLRNGSVVEEARDEKDILEFSRMLHKKYSSRTRKHFPNIAFFEHMKNHLVHTNKGKIFVVRYNGKIIGGSACVYSGDTVYLWFSGGMTKTYLTQYPGVLAVWKALKDAKENGFCHLEFMDAGLPFKRHGYREFVLRFGGKQLSTRRWFRLRWSLINRILVKIYS
ncbi:MAG: GNAT family N-acetyltransferase [Bacteroides sp.]|nr:GNAT family N-acetyltransferase [Bacteroides sp.]